MFPASSGPLHVNLVEIRDIECVQYALVCRRGSQLLLVRGRRFGGIGDGEHGDAARTEGFDETSLRRIFVKVKLDSPQRLKINADAAARETRRRRLRWRCPRPSPPGWRSNTPERREPGPAIGDYRMSGRSPPETCPCCATLRCGGRRRTACPPGFRACGRSSCRSRLWSPSTQLYWTTIG